MSADALFLPVVDRAEVDNLLHFAPGALDLEETVVAADHEVRGDQGAVRAGDQVRLAALDSGQGADFLLQVAVDALDRAVEGDERVFFTGASPATAWRLSRPDSSIPMFSRRYRQAVAWEILKPAPSQGMLARSRKQASAKPPAGKCPACGCLSRCGPRCRRRSAAGKHTRPGPGTSSVT